MMSFVLIFVVLRNCLPYHDANIFYDHCITYQFLVAISMWLAVYERKKDEEKKDEENENE